MWTTPKTHGGSKTVRKGTSYGKLACVAVQFLHAPDLHKACVVHDRLEAVGGGAEPGPAILLNARLSACLGHGGASNTVPFIYKSAAELLPKILHFNGSSKDVSSELRARR